MTPGQIAYEARGVDFGGGPIMKDSVTWDQLPAWRQIELEQMAEAVIRSERRAIAQWLMYADGNPTKRSRAVITGTYKIWADTLPKVDVEVG